MKRFKRRDGAQDLCTILIFFTVKSLLLLFESEILPQRSCDTCVCVCFLCDAEIAGVEIWPRPEQDSGLRVVQERALAPHLPRGTGEDPQPHQHRVRAPPGL